MWTGQTDRPTGKIKLVVAFCSVFLCKRRRFLRSAHTAVFMCFVWISEQTAIISLYNINWLVCITETESVYCAVRTEYPGYYLGKFQASKGRYTTQAVFRRRLTAFIWTQSVVGPCEKCAEQSGTETDISASASVSINPQLLHTNLYLNTTLSEEQAGVAWEPPHRGMIFLNVRTLERRALPHCLLSGCRRLH